MKKLPGLTKFNGMFGARKKMALALVVIAVVAGVSGIVVSRKRAHPTEQVKHPIQFKADEVAAETHGNGSNSFGFVQFFVSMRDAVQSVSEKLDRMRRSEEENERLKLENANLRVQLEGLRFTAASMDASGNTHRVSMRLNQETGNLVGRTLASIEYHMPSNLLPEQLYTLAVSYFKAREDEKAAVIMTFLTGSENEQYKTAKDYVMTGVAWYRLDNYNLAVEYFDRALKVEESDGILPYLAQARLWKALSYEKLSKHTKAQFWMQELVDHHPRSAEAAWVNGRTATRDIAKVQDDAEVKNGE